MFLVKNLNFAYGTKKILQGINFSIRCGSFFAIIGPNGSGKTTLLNLLSGHLQPVAGEIFFQDKALKSYSIQELGRKIAIVPQDIGIKFPFTCLEVVMMGRTPFKNRMKDLSREDMDIVYRCMEATDTLSFAGSLITEVSGGERQRIILAKALAQTPEVLFLDEAFSSMDIHYSVKALNLLKDLVEQDGLTVVSIMHDLNMADSFSDITLALDQGKLVQCGRTSEIIDPAFIHSLFKINVVKTGARGLAVLPEL